MFLAATAAGLAARDAHAQATREPLAQRLFDVRTANLAQDEPQGYLLLSWGVSSVATGAVMGATGWGGERWRWFGVNTAVWGAINTAIAIPWVLSFARDRASITSDAALTGDALATRHRASIDRSSHQSVVYAINAALDVVYVTGGAIAWWAGTQQTPNTFGSDFLLGAGMAALTQGAWLLVFDGVGWLLAQRRTRALAAW